MADIIRFGGIKFDRSYRHAVRDDGLQIKFTKSERLVLTELTKTPRKILARDQLLDAISGHGSDSSDRNIDFVINRIRRKLGDTARHPDYIATHYGEGYSWVCERPDDIPASTGAYAVIGPVRGVPHVDNLGTKAQDFATRLQVCLTEIMPPDRKVILDPKCPSPEEFSNGCPKFSIDLHFVRAGDSLNCVFTLREFQTGTVMLVNRKTVFKADEVIDNIAQTTALQISDGMWRGVIEKSSMDALPTSPPLHFGLYDAAREFSCSGNDWRNNEARLRKTIAENESDAVAKLLLATNIHLKYIENGMHTMLGPDTRQADDDEMESLVLASLPHIQSNDVLVLAAAKLLFFLDRGYRRFAVEMAENAYQNSAAIATSLTIVGQMRMFLGEYDLAIDCLDQARELSVDGTQFRYYLMFITCQVHLAAGNWDELQAALNEFYKIHPEAKYTISIFFASTGTDSIRPEAREIAAQLSKDQAQAILKLTNYVYARLFDHAEPRENIFCGLLAATTQQFGADVVPAEVRRCVPSLVALL